MATSPRAHQDILAPLRRATMPAVARWRRKGKEKPCDVREGTAAATWDLVLTSGEPLVVAWRGPAGEAGRGTLEALPAAARRAPLRVWTPAVDTLLTRVNWPGRRRAKLVQALPFLLEEQLLMEPEALDFTHRQTAEGIVVAVTAKAQLDAWRTAFADAGLGASFCPLSLGLPLAEGAWTCRYADGQWAVRTGVYGGFGAMGRATVPPAPLVQALREASAAGTSPAVLHLCDGDEALGAMLAASLDIPVVQDARPAGTGVVPPFRLGETQGAMTAAGRAAIRALRPAIVAAGLSVLLGVVAMTAQWVRLGAMHARLQAAETQLFAQSFPDVPVLDPASQMASRARALAARAGGAGSFLGLLGQAAPALKTLPPGALGGLHYRTGLLDVEVALGNFSALTALKTALAARGLTVTVHHVMSRHRGVRAQLSVRRAS